MAAATMYISNERSVRSMVSCAARVSSKTPMIAASEVSLIRIVQRPTKGGIMRRTAWGTITWRIMGTQPRPSERAASTWPVGIDWMPPRTTSAVLTIIQRLIARTAAGRRSEEHTSELQSRLHLVCRLLLEKKKNDHGHRGAARRAT